MQIYVIKLFPSTLIMLYAHGELIHPPLTKQVAA